MRNRQLIRGDIFVSQLEMEVSMQQDFLQEEVRCEFLVSEKRKKIWQKQIELIEQFQRVCDKYSLKYYASNGTLLGVVRHKGFVPWDDDVDIVMPRKDYQKLLEVAEKEFDNPYYLQTAKKQHMYYRNYARLRNQETTAMPYRDWNRECCNGIFIDIFPMDGCYNNVLKDRWQQLSVKIHCALANTYVYYPDFSSYHLLRAILYRIAQLYCKIKGYDVLLERTEQIRSQVDFEKAEMICQLTHGNSFLKFPAKYYEESVMMDFEYIQLPVPKAYDSILKTHYGNYMQLPPMEKRGLHHEILFDPDKPYTEYIGKMTKEEAKDLLNNY